jgi:hypothetical protein
VNCLTHPESSAGSEHRSVMAQLREERVNRVCESVVGKVSSQERLLTF